MQDLINQYNALDGQTVTRAYLVELFEKMDSLNVFDNELVNNDINFFIKKQFSEATEKLENLLYNNHHEQFKLTIANKIDLPIGLGAPRHEGIAKEALDNCSRLKPGYKFTKGGGIEKAKVSKKAIKKHLSKQTEKQLANDYAYIFSADLDRVEARILDSKAAYKKHLNTLTDKVFKNQEYLDTISFYKAEKKEIEIKKTTSKKSTRKPAKKSTKNYAKLIASLLSNNFKKSSLPILDYIKLDPKGNFSITNLEMQLQFKIDSIKNYPTTTILLHAVDFAKILRTTQINSIDNNGNIETNKGNFKVKLSKDDVKEYPELVSTNNKNDIVAKNIESKYLDYLFKNIAGNDDLRPVLSGVYFDAEENHIAATNAWLLTYKKEDVKNSVLIPKFKTPVGLNFDVYKLNKSNAMLIDDNIKITLRLIDGTYVKYLNVIPKNENKLSLNKKEVLEFIKNGLSVSPNKKETNVILNPKENRITLTYNDNINNNNYKKLTSKKVVLSKKFDLDVMYYFNANLFVKALNYFDKDTINLKSPDVQNRALIFEEELLLMPKQPGKEENGLGLSFQKKKDAPKGLKISINPIQIAPTTLTNQKPTVQPNTENMGVFSVAVPEVLDNTPKHKEQPKQEVAPTPTPKPTNKKYKTAADLENETKANVDFFKVNGDLQKFLGNIEVKPVQSLLVTLDTEEGGGKTHTFFQWANVFSNAGYSTIIWSLEEHKSSEVSKSKSRKYFTPYAMNNIVVESENDGETPEQTYKRLIASIKDFDVIFIDSLAKLIELNSRINVDLELRKAFNGKLIFLIKQRTSSGKARGGSKAQFDGDIILKGYVDRDDFRNNYIYNHKNRYNDYAPISDLKYSPFYQSLKPKEEEAPAEAPKSLVFS